MKTLKFDGNTLEYTAADTHLSGAPVLIGSRIGICVNNMVSGNVGTVSVKGIHEVPKATGQAWTQGDKVYWDDTNKNFTTTASGNTLIGYIAAAAASADTTGLVNINTMNA